MNDRDLHPRRYNAYGRDGSHYAIVLTPRWEHTDPQGPDIPQSWGSTPEWDFKIEINGVLVDRLDLDSVAAGDDALQISPVPSNEPERPQNGRLIDASMARTILDHRTAIADELYAIWLREKEAETVVDDLLDDG